MTKIKMIKQLYIGCPGPFKLDEKPISFTNPQRDNYRNMIKKFGKKRG